MLPLGVVFFFLRELLGIFNGYLLSTYYMLMLYLQYTHTPHTHIRTHNKLSHCVIDLLLS